MKPFLKTLSLLSGLLAASCLAQKSRNLSADAESQIRALDTELARAAEDGNAPRFVSYYADDASLFPPNGPAIHGGTAVRKTLEQLFAQGLVLTLNTAKLVVSAGGDLAYSHGSYSSTLNDAQGKPVMDMGKFVLVFRKQPDDSWKIVADIFNSDLPVRIAN